eukprot:TRINITY_DN6936_c0_g3_i1.p1 TRINITY_DN6936_c0_g3~~TRINITY_DN6936_c0_g3_i1.p1  ORF type:complete len:301 (-),score=42.19 TRINITY_DN6936_c0_g3_i1:132-1034(-)
MIPTKQKSTETRVQNAVIGAAAGIVTGFVLQPLEVVKMFIIVNPLKIARLDSSGLFRASLISIQQINRLEGVRGFFRGMSPAMLRYLVGSGVYFAMLQEFRVLFADRGNDELRNFFASSLARLSSGFITNPLTVVRARCEVVGCNDYNGVIHALRKIYREEGIRGMMKGSVATAWRDAPFAGIYFMILSKSNQYLKELEVPRSLATFISGMIGGSIASVATQPFEVIRTRIQVNFHGKTNDQEYTGILDAIKRIHKEEGPQGFMRGLLPRLMRKPLNNALTFTLFEIMSTAGINSKHSSF